ncbi:MAG: Mrp/NBP35 family ATP-binding protein [Desulfurococcaceae archaeon]
MSNDSAGNGEKRGSLPKFSIADMFINQARRRLGNIRFKVLVMSGKGGVGKSFISSMISLALAMKNRRVVLFDADVYGSSIPHLLGIQGLRHFADEKGNIIPVEGPLGVKVVAVNLMLDAPDVPLVWRGPLVARAVVELLARVNWGEADYMIIDMPPGTGDVPLSIAQAIPDITGAILVTAPSTLSEIIVSKAANFLASAHVKLLGIVENMSYFKCPYCGKVSWVMGSTGAEKLAAKYGTIVLGKIPLDPEINDYVDKGVPYILARREGEAAKSILDIADRLISLVENKIPGS